jgi:tRNA(Ile)-lysidine synthase
MRLPHTDCRVLYRHYGADENLLSGSFDCALAGRPRRALKKILQESGLPPWDRSRAPLIFCGDSLAWIGGVGACEGFQVAAGETGWAVNWQLPLAEEPE